jgi:hypothetical protein
VCNSQRALLLHKIPTLLPNLCTPASMAGSNICATRPPTNVLLLKLNPALNPAQETYTAQALRDGGFITGDDPTGVQTGRMTAARWTVAYEQLKSLGILQGPLDPSTAYALQFAQ